MKHGIQAGFLAVILSGAAMADVPEGIAVPGATTVAHMQAEGEQIYECQPDANGGLSWQFREPVAVLREHGQVVGKHFAGPTWTLEDGSSIIGKVTGRAAAATPKDIPLLRLEVVSRSGSGRLDAVIAIQRLNTQGGTLTGSCNQAGGRIGVPYTADYAFLQSQPR
jgi:hypothetical protein